MTVDARPLIAHVVYRFDTGGLENGVVNLVNHLPRIKYRHIIISLTKITEFRQRVTTDNVSFFELDKNPGHSISLYPRLFKLFRELQPNIVHTRNLAALEMTVPAWAARVPARLHSEHGREGADLDPGNLKYRTIRKLYRPFVTNYLALSKDLSHYLSNFIGIPSYKLAQIYNGVDSNRFFPHDQRQKISDCPFQSSQLRLFGTIGRMHAVKDQLNLAKAFIHALHIHPSIRDRLRLIMIGDGPMRNQIVDYLKQSGVADLCWLPGERTDIPAILRGLDCFVLPSISEGISNTILEAMATGLPVIATNVGGNPELVSDGITGKLVPTQNVPALAAALIEYAEHPDNALIHGKSARKEIEQRFSIEAMTSAYCALYDSLLKAKNNAHGH